MLSDSEFHLLERLTESATCKNGVRYVRKCYHSESYMRKLAYRLEKKGLVRIERFKSFNLYARTPEGTKLVEQKKR